MRTPVATYLTRDVRLLLAAATMAVLAVWALHHSMSVVTAVTGHGDPMAFTWLGAFLLMWWMPVCWLEKPYRVTNRVMSQLKNLTVTVQVPVFNEDPDRVRHCLTSLFEQTVLPTKIRVVDDGTTTYDYAADGVVSWFLGRCEEVGIIGTWDRTANQGKRHAQMHVLADDDGDIYMTLDSDSILDRVAIEEGLKPFADLRVHSVAGMVAVWNSHGNWLARLTCLLYTPFTRGYRSAQSAMGSVMVNSGTLAWYRGDTIRKYAGAYENEQFLGRPMQMNDDSMMTMYALLEGRAVHQPSAVAYTIVPERFGEYRRQQMRWMRGTLVRTWWWFKYMPMHTPAFWMPVIELMQLFLGIAVWPLLIDYGRHLDHPAQMLWTWAVVATLINYLTSLRFFTLQRDDESLGFQVGIFLLSPLAGIWRIVVLMPMVLYSYVTFWKVGDWGTRKP